MQKGLTYADEAARAGEGMQLERIVDARETVRVTLDGQSADRTTRAQSQAALYPGTAQLPDDTGATPACRRTCRTLAALSIWPHRNVSVAGVSGWPVSSTTT
jgi:hypothetical protein